MEIESIVYSVLQFCNEVGGRWTQEQMLSVMKNINRDIEFYHILNAKKKKGYSKYIDLDLHFFTGIYTRLSYTYYAKIFHQKGYELKDIKNTSVREAYRYLYRKINKKRIERQRRKEIERYMKNNRKIRNKKKVTLGMAISTVKSVGVKRAKQYFSHIVSKEYIYRLFARWGLSAKLVLEKDEYELKRIAVNKYINKKSKTFQSSGIDEFVEKCIKTKYFKYILNSFSSLYRRGLKGKEIAKRKENRQELERYIVETLFDHLERRNLLKG